MNHETEYELLTGLKHEMKAGQIWVMIIAMLIAVAVCGFAANLADKQLKKYEMHNIK